MAGKHTIEFDGHFNEAGARSIGLRTIRVNRSPLDASLRCVEASQQALSADAGCLFIATDRKVQQRLDVAREETE